MLKGLPSFMGMTKKKSFILSKFNYFPLDWNFCSKRETDKMEKIQNRALRMVLDDYESDYETSLQKGQNAKSTFGYNKDPCN